MIGDEVRWQLTEQVLARLRASGYPLTPTFQATSTGHGAVFQTRGAGNAKHRVRLANQVGDEDRVREVGRVAADAGQPAWQVVRVMEREAERIIGGPLPEPDVTSLVELVRAADDVEAQARALLTEAAELRRAGVRSLRELGLSHGKVAAALGFSRARAAELAAD